MPMYLTISNHVRATNNYKLNGYVQGLLSKYDVNNTTHVTIFHNDTAKTCCDIFPFIDWYLHEIYVQYACEQPLYSVLNLERQL